MMSVLLVPVVMLLVVVMTCSLQSTMAFSYNREQQKNHNEINRDNSLSIDKNVVVPTHTVIDATSTINRRGFFTEATSLLLFSSTVSTVLVSPIALTGRPNPSNAIGEGEERMVFRRKPTAPVGALIPAVQQRLLLEVAIDAAKAKNTSKIKRIIPELVPKKNDTTSANNDNYYNSSGSSDYSIIGASQTVLRGDVTRAAMDLYQTNLDYNSILGGRDPNSNNNNDATAVTATAFTVTDPRWKKSYIRANDGLPDIRKVIGADLDVRQLFRNDVQQKLDDAAAELYDTTVCDEEELLTLLLEAAVSFDQWLDRIRYGDIRDAIEKAGNGERPKIYDTYTAGFRPPSARLEEQ